MELNEVWLALNGLAHIVGGGPVWPQWVAGAVALGGLVGAFEFRTHSLRRSSGIVSLMGMLTLMAACAALPSAPLAPNVTLRIAQPPANGVVHSPVLVTVCANNSSVPGQGRLLTVLVDGRQVAEVNAASVALPLSDGAHTLRVELVSTDHRQFAPPVLTDETIRVLGVGTLPASSGCGR